MQKIEVGTIKTTIISNDLPEIMESISTSITDDSKSVLENAMKQLSNCNKHLGKSLKQLNTYVDSMAEAFEEADKQASDLMNQNTATLASSSTSPSAGTKGYLALI
ncbi:hypothetical protein [Enterococcus sp. 5H]|uniref:hypothetical protein n=1 Tax=Enterococcus sp. 5H TaxID=1229490 RepID=UPI00230358A3|nr:hypothetical protein [Enterococcus sp. 5H]MDA9471089.1 hypothetical protein [Enterococcus sp. 5H]